MKLIKANIKPDRLEALASILRKSGVPGMTVYEVRGFGQEYLASDIELVGYLRDRIVIEIAAEDTDVERIINIIRSNAVVGTKGGVMIFVVDLDTSWRIVEQDGKAVEMQTV